MLKLDYEKGFDKVGLDFLDDLLLKRGFCPRIRNCIRLTTRGGSVAVKMNNTLRESFLPQLKCSGKETPCLLTCLF